MKQKLYRLNISIGFQIFLFWLLITHIIQIFWHPLLEGIKIYYNSHSLNSYILILFIITMFGLVFLLNKLLPTIKVPFKLKISIVDRIMFFLLLILLLSKIYIFFQYGLAYRHIARVSEMGVLGKLNFIITPIAISYTLLLLSIILNKRHLNKIQSVNLYLILISFLVLISSALMGLFVIIVIIMLFFKKHLIKIVTKQINIINLIGYSFVLLIIAMLTVYFGFANKIGFIKAYEFLLSQNFNYILDRILTRVSTYEETLLIMFSTKIFDINFQFNMISNYINVLSSRLHFLFPFIEFNSETYKYTFNRVSFELLFSPEIVNKLEHAGSTPGIFASMFFLPFPLGIIYEILILIIVIRGFNNLFRGVKFNILGVALLSFFFARVIEDTLSMLYIIEPSFFLFISFVCFSFYVDINNKKIIYIIKKE